MLVLARRRGESITLVDTQGREVTITVVAQLGAKVRIGVDAPEDVVIFRSELGPVEKFQAGPADGRGEAA